MTFTATAKLVGAVSSALHLSIELAGLFVVEKARETKLPDLVESGMMVLLGFD
jgi:hypothetical protein